MKQDVFQFHIQNLAYGWCRVRMLINDKEINFNAGYLGPNPLASFINVCSEFLIDREYANVGKIEWRSEPGQMTIKHILDEQDILHLDIVEKSEDGDEVYQEWHEAIPFKTFLATVVAEGFRVLNAFGLYGYYCSWSDHIDFPLAHLLRITERIKAVERDDCDSICTDITKELDCLKEYISKLEITEETRMDACTIYYESWQLQCCGDPFSVGDKVEWTCMMPDNYKNAHGIIIDFEEDHHGFASHTISGTVTRIIAERSEFPKGKKEVWYHKTRTIQEEITRADGWERELNDDDTTERTFWGYIVEFKDVIVKPIMKNG